MNLLVIIIIFALLCSSFIVIAMLLAPLEALVWWAGWHKPNKKESPIASPTATLESKDHYIVFLDGIAKASSKNYENVEALLNRLRKTMPDAAVIGDIIPYAATGVPLTQRRPLAKFWRFALAQKKVNSGSPVGFLINLRNLFQVLVSADRRYGAVFHAAKARLIIKKLLEHGYSPGSGKAITLIGYSGGAQVAVGVSSFLKESLRAPVDLISLGGVMSANGGLKDLRYIYHISGEKDAVERLGAIIFPGRWSWNIGSSWNKAKRKGKFTYIPMPACTHDGARSYLDAACRVDARETHLDMTERIVTDIILNRNVVHGLKEKRGFYTYLYDPLKAKTTLEPLNS